MKKSLFILSITILGCTLVTNAASYKFVAKNNSIKTKICIAVAEDNKPALKSGIRTKGSAVSTSVLSRIVANSLTCNDLLVTAFAIKYNALETYRYLNRYTSKKNKFLPSTGTIRDISAQHNEQDNGRETLILISGR
ncbi:DUF3718 domain-containing protein [Colwellia sp. C1TZA3]|uniref:DUF3718 domain-containing protein n=1 Tax=Colwellia sp. C1TZA3 TaxID=2508879 RepID=UPI0011B9CC1E|nr:DUF3718 domain-containing protein [Colwellia sp. C1TZA3]TWX71365.1 DUF3718 domain-containing protein [Colwellia sp. C1TZA3]